MAKKKLMQDSTGQIFPITTADAVYLDDGSKTIKKYVDDELNNLMDLIGSGTEGTGGSDTSSEHTHDYLPLTGGTITGDVYAENNVVIDGDLTAYYGTTTLDELNVYNVATFGDDVCIRDGHTVYIGQGEVYHPGNKPTASEIGAFPTTGGTINGHLYTEGDLEAGGDLIAQYGHTVVNTLETTGVVNFYSNLNTSADINCTATITANKYNFPTNANDTDDYAYITVVHTDKRTAMEFHVGNNCQIEGADDSQNSDYQATNDDRFIWRLPDLIIDDSPELHNEDSHTMQLYNWWMIGGWPTLKVAEIYTDSIYTDTIHAECADYNSAIRKLRPPTDTPTDSFLGDSSYRYYDVYCTRGAFNGSDSKLKENIKTISRKDFGGIELLSEEEVESNVSSYDLYDYIKNASLYSYNYKTSNEVSDNDCYIGILADNVPDNVFNVIGTYSKTEEEYQQEIEERPAIIERYNELLKAGVYNSEKPGVIDRELGMSLAEIRDRALNEPEEPVRLINAPAQVSMLQEVLSIALNKIEILEAYNQDLEERLSNLENN